MIKLFSNFLNKETNVYEIPFKLLGADQVMPVQFYIYLTVTIDNINIQPGKINFGKFYEGTASTFEINMDNMSLLPQQILFYPLPKEISLDNKQNPFWLLPKEKVLLNFVYRSTSVPGVDKKKDESFLKCKIITGNISTKEIKIPYIADTMKCPLEFTSLISDQDPIKQLQLPAQQIQLPVIQENEEYKTTLILTNKSKKDIIFEFFLPYYEICGLKLDTMVGKLKESESVQILLIYNAFFKKLGPFTIQEIEQKIQQDLKQENEQEQQPEETQKQEKQDPKKKQEPPKKLTKQQLQQQEEEQRIQEQLEKEKELEKQAERKKIEDNFDFDTELQKFGGKLLEFNQNTENYQQHYTWLFPCYFKYQDMNDSSKQITYLEVNTVTVSKHLVLSQTEIDFGQVAVGIKETKEIIIENRNQKEENISADILHYYSGFTILNALRPVTSEKPRTLVVQFQPNDQKLFESTVKIKSDTTWVSCKLKGQGVRPKVSLNQEKGIFFMGGCVQGDQISKTFEVHNDSDFQIKFNIVSKIQGIQNINNSKAFSFIPQQGIILPLQKTQIQVVFKPDRISENFYNLIEIDVPNQEIIRELFIYGYCYNRSGFVQIYKPYEAIPTVEEMKERITEECPFDRLKINDIENIISPQNKQILLEFEKNDVDNLIKRIVIGNSKIIFDPKAEKPFNFEVVMPKDDKYFQVDQLKGSVPAGQEQIINFKFKPPQKDPFIQNIEALNNLGQWIEQKVELKVQGGYIKSNQPDQLLIDIILKVFIQTI